MLLFSGSGVRRLGIAVLLAAAACSAPDSSGLFAPAAASPIRSEAPNPDTTSGSSAGEPPLQPPSRPVPSGSSGEGNAPVGGVSAPGSNPGSGASAPVALEPDAGAPIAEPAAADAGAEPTPPEPPVPPDTPAPPPQPEPQCAGAAFDGSCWYVGALGASCSTVCATRGGFSPASLAVVGTPEQGGSIDACDAILQAFGAPAGVVNEGFRNDGLGFGCHLFIDAEGTATAWWLTAPDLTPDISDPRVRMVCGCRN